MYTVFLSYFQAVFFIQQWKRNALQYRFFGEQVVKAAIDSKTHYVDISGEPQVSNTVFAIWILCIGFSCLSVPGGYATEIRRSGTKPRSICGGRMWLRQHSFGAWHRFYEEKFRRWFKLCGDLYVSEGWSRGKSLIAESLHACQSQIAMDFELALKTPAGVFIMIHANCPVLKAAWS